MQKLNLTVTDKLQTHPVCISVKQGYSLYNIEEEMYSFCNNAFFLCWFVENRYTIKERTSINYMVLL